MDFLKILQKIQEDITTGVFLGKVTGSKTKTLIST